VPVIGDASASPITAVPLFRPAGAAVRRTGPREPDWAAALALDALAALPAALRDPYLRSGPGR
jgi:hypothetical protein